MAAVTVESLSKEYVIGGGLPSLSRMLRRGGGAVSGGERFLALKDVSFEVDSGEVVGIIGKNGAGKSTLLKILSRVTEPTSGRALLSGPASSLLEVGTGFHPDLTGRENVFLNGVILGMSRAEIRRKFDEIVAFSEVERFLDTPVKRYSSGMYVRLAFAIAVHRDPEILIVDEVLAVGDAAFQKKCFAKMRDLMARGGTILFVSHNMQAIRQLCTRALLQRDGVLAADGEPAAVIEEYLREGNRWDGDAAALDEFIAKLPPDPAFRLLGIEVTQSGRPVAGSVHNGAPVEVAVRYRLLERTTGFRIYIDLCDDQDAIVLRSFHDEDNDAIPTMEPGAYVSRAVVPADLLGPAAWAIRVGAGIHNRRNCLPPSGARIPIRVEHTGRYNRAYVTDAFRGKLALPLRWEIAKAERDA